MRDEVAAALTLVAHAAAHVADRVPPCGNPECTKSACVALSELQGAVVGLRLLTGLTPDGEEGIDG
mgnify:CR=1 FL=1